MDVAWPSKSGAGVIAKPGPRMDPAEGDHVFAVRCLTWRANLQSFRAPTGSWPSSKAKLLPARTRAHQGRHEDAIGWSAAPGGSILPPADVLEWGTPRVPGMQLRLRRPRLGSGGRRGNVPAPCRRLFLHKEGRARPLCGMR